MLEKVPGKCPLITIWGVPVTEHQVIERLAAKVRVMGLQDRGLMFHALRRTRLTIVFQNQVPMESIRANRAWASNTVWQCLKHTDSVTSVVVYTLATLFT